MAHFIDPRINLRAILLVQQGVSRRQLRLVLPRPIRTDLLQLIVKAAQKR